MQPGTPVDGPTPSGQPIDGSVTGPSDAELITAVRGGDRTSFGLLYQRHVHAATTLARQFSRSATEADDLVSESFARVLDTLLDGRGPDSAFRAYLFTAIRHTAFDRTRKDKRLQFTDDLAPYESVDENIDPVLLKMESSFIAKAFAQLPERWRTVLWHTQVEGQSAAEVGVLLGMAPNAVSSLTFRAREGLREAYLQVHMADTVEERCRTTITRLGAWTRGGLSKRENAQVDTHLQECATCPALAAELGEINSGLRGLLAPILLGAAAMGYVANLPPVAAVIRVGAEVGTVQAGGAAASPPSSASGSSASSGASTGTGPLAGVAQTAARVVARVATRQGMIVSGLAAAAMAVVVVLAVTDAPSPTETAADIPTAGAPLSSPAAELPLHFGSTTPVPVPSAVPTTVGTTDAVLPPVVPTTVVTPTTTGPSSVSVPPVFVPGVPVPSATVPSPPAAPPSIAPPTTAPPTTAPPTTATPTVPVPTTAPPSTAPPTTAPPTATTPPPTSGPPTSAPPTSAAPPSSTEPTPTPTGPVLPPVVPGDVVAGDPVVPSTLVAGGGGLLTVPLTNAGDTTAPEVAVDFGLPPGVSVGDAALTGTGTALRPIGAAFGAQALTIDCPATADGFRCLVPAIPAHTARSLEVRLLVDAAAADGVIAVTLGGRTVTSATLAIGPGYETIEISTNTVTVDRFSTLPLTLTAAPVPGSAAPGVVTVPVLLGDELVITDLAGSGCSFDATRTLVECAPDSTGALNVGLTATVLADEVTTAVTAQLPGGRSLAIDIGTVTGVGVLPHRPGSAVTMTGPFGATAAGGALLECSEPGVTRQSCGTPGLPDAPTMRSTDRSTDLPALPAGARVVSAELTLAGTARTSGAAPILVVGGQEIVLPEPGTTTSVATAPWVMVPAVGAVDLRTLDVTDLPMKGGTLASALAGGTTVTVTDPQANRLTSIQSPLSGWTLTVVWVQPGGPARTVELRNGGQSSTTGAPFGDTELIAAADGSGPLLDLWVCAVAIDPWAAKSVVTGGATITGVPDHDFTGRTATGRHNGFGLVHAAHSGDPATVIAGAQAVDLSTTGGASVVFRNAAVVPVPLGNTNDQVWIGPVLAVRAAG